MEPLVATKYRKYRKENPLLAASHALGFAKNFRRGNMLITSMGTSANGVLLLGRGKSGDIDILVVVERDYDWPRSEDWSFESEPDWPCVWKRAKKVSADRYRCIRLYRHERMFWDDVAYYRTRHGMSRSVALEYVTDLCRSMLRGIESIIENGLALISVKAMVGSRVLAINSLGGVDWSDGDHLLCAIDDVVRGVLADAEHTLMFDVPMEQEELTLP